MAVSKITAWKVNFDELP